jgi:uncharacterized membrane protein (UPF0127 family)
MKRMIMTISLVIFVILISLAAAELYFVHVPGDPPCQPNGSLMTQTSTETTNQLSGFSVSCIRIVDSAGKIVFDGFVYVATSQFQLEQGFQNATSFGDCNGFATRANGCDGMIFVFPTTQELCFWMHNTIIPLRQVWISENGTVSVVYSANSETDATVCHPGKYVLEASSSAQISVGDSVFLNSNET